MLSVLGQVLPEAVGIAISPIPIIGLILILFTKQARTNSLMFLLGWLAGLTVVSFVVVALVNAGKISVGASSTDTGVSWLTLILGLALISLAFRQWRSRPKAGETAATPKWMSTIDSIKPGAAFGLGVLLSAVNPKNLLLDVAGASAIAAAPLDTTQTIIVTIVFILIASVSIIGPVLYVQIAGKNAQVKLNELKGWLIQHNAAIMTVLLLIIGVKMVGNGLALFG